MPTSQLTCLLLIFNSPIRQCKLEPTAAAPRQHLSIQTTAPSSSSDAGGLRHHFTVTPTLHHLAEGTLSTTVPAPHRRPKLGPAFCQSTTHPDCVISRYYRNYVTTWPIFTAHIFYCHASIPPHDRVFDILTVSIHILQTFKQLHSSFQLLAVNVCRQFTTALH